MGDVQCDANGCYDVTSSITYGDVVNPAPLMPIPLVSPSATAAQIAATSIVANPGTGLSASAVYIGAAVLLVLLLEGSSRRR
jgi:hypothetical protein